MESAIPPTLHKLVDVSARTGLSRSAIYREIYNPKNTTGEVRFNPAGRLKVVHIGRSVRVREQDLVDFMNALAKPERLDARALKPLTKNLRSAALVLE
jgi:predicted DNA-binding transcriptional regulator AlpA